MSFLDDSADALPESALLLTGAFALASALDVPANGFGLLGLALYGWMAAAALLLPLLAVFRLRTPALVQGPYATTGLFGVADVAVGALAATCFLHGLTGEAFAVTAAWLVWRILTAVARCGRHIAQA